MEAPSQVNPQVAWVWEAATEWKSSPKLLESLHYQKTFLLSPGTVHFFKESEYETFSTSPLLRPCLRSCNHDPWSWSDRLSQSFHWESRPLGMDQGQASGSSQPTLVGSHCQAPSPTNDFLSRSSNLIGAGWPQEPWGLKQSVTES